MSSNTNFGAELSLNLQRKYLPKIRDDFKGKFSEFPLVHSGRKLLPTDSLFFQINSVKTYRYRYRSVIISNSFLFTDTDSYPPSGTRPPKITDM